MTLEELESRTAEIVRPVITSAETLFTPYIGMRVSTSLWRELLILLFSVVQPASIRAAEVSRDHYDSERERVGLPPHPIPLADLTIERFMKDMDDVRPMVQRGLVNQNQIHEVALRVARSVENSGRWTVMKAPDQPDPALEEAANRLEVTEGGSPRRARGPNGVKGWARVATGRETCGWCWMLVSRGPVYSSAGSAGSAMDERDSMQLVGAGEFDSAQHMHAWHTGCDCKVVPVFDLNNWDGKERYEAAQQLWREATRGYSGKGAINAYRRAVEAGGIQEILNGDQAAA